MPADRVRDLTDKLDTAPRLVREVTGDFVLTVRVHVSLDKDAGLAKEMAVVKTGRNRNEYIWPFLAAGVEFDCEGETRVRYGFSRWRDDQGFQVGNPFQRTVRRGPDRPQPDFYGGYASPDPVHGGRLSKADPDALTIRYTRRGDTVLTSGSLDGRTWFEMLKLEGWVPKDQVKVSLFAHHGSDKEHTVTFSEYTLEPLKAEKR
jgi:hypothetical protein